MTAVRTTEQRDLRLELAAGFFTLAVLLHNSDHVRRGADTVSGDVFVAGTLAIAVEVAVVVLVFQRHRLAPLAATAIGYALAAGYVITHFLPQRSWLSDSFVSARDVSPLSWGAASIEVVAALALGTAGLLAVHDRGGLAGATSATGAEQPLRAGLLHPAALALLLGNAAILVISLAQL